MAEAGNGNDAMSSSGVSTWILVGIAILIVVFYMMFLYWMFSKADEEAINETVWARYASIVGSFEAIVFTAVGWLFGREVNRKQAETASEKTQEAEDAKIKAGALKEAIMQATGGPGGIGPASADTYTHAMQTLRSRAEQMTI